MHVPLFPVQSILFRETQNIPIKISSMLFRIKLLGFCVSKRILLTQILYIFGHDFSSFPSYIRQPLSVLLYSIRQRNSDIIPCSRINPKKDSANEEKRIIKFTTISSSLQLYTACSTFGPTRQNDPFFH